MTDKPVDDECCLLKSSNHLLLCLFSPDSSTAVTVSASPPRGITEGGALRLACCSPAAGPETLYTWYQNTSISPRHTTQVWNISQVTPDDSGSFYCQIQTGDNVQNSIMLDIDVECKSNLVWSQYYVKSYIVTNQKSSG